MRGFENGPYLSPPPQQMSLREDTGTQSQVIEFPCAVSMETNSL